MDDSVLAPLSRWENFYVIVGSSAGALTGLQFVVMTLISENRVTSSMTQIRAFGSPTMVHFCVALLISAIVCMPWPTLSGPAYALGATGLGGVIYSLSAIRHTKRQKGYRPELSDWIWYMWLPLSIYLALALSAVPLQRNPAVSLFVVAAVALALLFIGIHNAWDTVTYIAVTHVSKEKKDEHS
jgi:hypothetical protein